MGQKNETIYIVARDCMQNELLLGYLTATSMRRCVCVDDFEYFNSVDVDMIDDQRLILIDCLGFNDSVLFDTIQSIPPSKSSSTILALMNLQARGGVEKTALEFGVRGFFYEHDLIADLVKGINAILSGEVWISRQKLFECLASQKKVSLQADKKQTILTRREVEILRLLSRGGSNESIANSLCISSHTVRTHIYNIFKKIDVPNRLQASLWAAKFL